MYYIIKGLDLKNPKKPLYLSGFAIDETFVSKHKKMAHLFSVLDAVLFIVSKLNEENFLNVKWDYEVLTSW